MAADFVDEHSVKEDENDYDIIIIGAGLAGLTCAYNILKKKIGLDILIIEENSEAGGRILSRNFSNTYHANFLQKHVTELLRTLHIKINEGSIDLAKEKILYTREKTLKVLPKFYGAEVHNFLRMIEENSSNREFSYYTDDEEAKHLAETSVEQLLRRIVYFPYARSLCRAFICSTCAMRNLNDISALWFLVMLNGSSGLINRLKIMIGDTNRYFVHGGMSNITNTLLKNILRQHGEIRYVEPVNKITFNNGRVYVSTEKNHFRCEFVVIAVPPSLQSRIAIEPPENSINSHALYTSADNVFFNVTYKKPFWNSNSTQDIVTTWDSNNNLNIVYDATAGNTEESVLAGFLAESTFIQTHKKGLFDTLNDCYKTNESSKYLRYKEYDQSLMDNEIKFGCPMSVLKPTSIDNHINYTGTSNDRCKNLYSTVSEMRDTCY
ncbi:PREDICTED: probable flavin-containing monoamine oxidase A [Eufriesea mexicana]|uniref:probable flavin-containing monoamine oxidase A n=1 Tax=Eufriesea mexicana TaxID=516756 RepID=UPI00083C44EA|nr:PREDICTED: probable flavin-containing monoamine oxidase A [Eufriesea mexicana]